MKTAKTVLLALALFIAIFAITPMVGTFYGDTGGCDDSVLSGAGNCAPTAEHKVVFPVIRTFSCVLWHQPSCATGTFLPGWDDGLLNGINIIIVLLLGTSSVLIANKILNRK